MAVPDPPFSSPRIMKVLEPSAGQYEVIVRVDPTLASKFPDKPFGTAITAIGLAQKDTDKFAGYTLVSIEPADKGAKDHYWIFQKLDGPEWTTTSRSKDNLTPTKFRGQTLVVKTEREVEPDTLPTSLSPFLEDGVTANPDYDVNLVSSVVTQTPNTGKAVLTEITETIDENAAALIGQRAYEQRQVVDTSEVLVVDGVDALAGLNAAAKLLVVSSQVTPLGNGKSVKEITTVPSWTQHTASEWSPELGAQITRTEQFVAPPVSFTDPNTSFQIVNADRSLKIVEVIPEDALNDYSLAFPIRIDIPLPKVLKSIAVIWNSQYSIGTQDTWGYDYASGTSGSVSMSPSDSASSSASITAEISPIFEDFAVNNLFAENRVFYMEGPVNQATILARLNTVYSPATVAMWPVFKPQSQSLVVVGQGVNVRANVSVALSNSWSEGGNNSNSSMKTVSDDFSVNLDNKSIQLPACIHNGITLTGGTSQAQAVSATAVMALVTTYGASVSAIKTKSGVAYGSVTPTSLPATEGTNTIPTSGLYLMDMDVASTLWTNWFKLRVEIFDASNLL